jgi:hypothetical protein
MDEQVAAAIARAAARRLSAEHGPELIVGVERALRPDGRPDRYVDPVSLGSLIVSAASLAWTIQRDLRARKAKPTRDVVAQRVRIELPASAVPPAARDQVIEVVVEQLPDDDLG